MIYDKDLSYMINHVIYFSLNREMCSYFTNKLRPSHCKKSYHKHLSTYLLKIFAISYLLFDIYRLDFNTDFLHQTSHQMAIP